MSSSPLVSFCFTTYKRKDLLQSTLESVRQQTFGDFEVIVSDNDPECAGRDVVEGMGDSRFKYFANGSNLGMKKSFNQSLKRSSGKYIVMIADDDPVYPDMLTTLMDLKDRYPGFGMYMGACNWFCTDPRIAQLYGLKEGLNSFLADIPEGTVRTYTSAAFLRNFFNFKIFSNYLWSTAIVERDVLVGMGGVPDYETAFLGDYAYLSIMGSHSGCVVINKALGHQTIHPHNFGRDQNDQIRIAVVNFVEYVSQRIKHVDGWPAVDMAMKRFAAMWAISHLNFLDRYYRLFKKEDSKDLNRVEREIFRIDFVKKYHFKYWLKKHFPRLHDLVVLVKKKIIHRS